MPDQGSRAGRGSPYSRLPSRLAGGERISNSRSLSRRCRFLLAEEKGAEGRSGGSRKTPTLFRGDQRFESSSLQRRVRVSAEPFRQGLAPAAPFLPRRRRGRAAERGGGDWHTSGREWKCRGSCMSCQSRGSQ